MSNLFIIGNGFDIEHKLRTTYSDFKKYVEKNDPIFFQSFYRIHEYSFERKYENHLMTEPLNDEYKSLWNKLEEHMGIVNEDYILSANVDMGLEYYDPYDEAIYETASNYLASLIEKIPELLFENLENWIKNIDISVEKKTYYIREDSNNLFLNFNYTNLLEKVYEIDSDQICYIHGRVGDKLIMGHNNDNKIEELKKERNSKFNYLIEELNNRVFESEEEYHEEYGMILDSEDNFDDRIEKLKLDLLIDYYEKTLKTPLEHINENLKFFNEIEKIEKIYIIGHSFGKVDYLYFKEISERIDSNVKWNIFYYDESKKDRFKTTILSLGVLEENIILKNSKEFFNIEINYN